MRAAFLSTLVLSMALGCARIPPTAYTFDPGPGAWEFDGNTQSASVRRMRYEHQVHGENLEIFEVTTPAPAVTSAEFSALNANARTLPPLGTPTALARSLGDDNVGTAHGYWVSQFGREHGDPVQAAAYVVPNGRRHFVVRLASREDDVEQLRGWLRDLLLRNFSFPAPQR